MPPRQRRGRTAAEDAASPSASPQRKGGGADAGCSGGRWVVATGISLGLLAYAMLTFHTAFPITSLEITMDREQALQTAAGLASKHSLRPIASDDGFRQAVDFGSEDDVQVFVELEHGLQAWIQMLQPAELPSFSPYYWVVRHFQEGEIAEAEIFFNPLGQPLGFMQKLPEGEPGAALSEEDARAIAINFVMAQDNETHWDVDLERYAEVEHQAEDRTAGRRDHSFTFELKEEAITVPLRDGKHRLSLHVAGDKVCGLRRYIQVPEAFSRRYAEMRSANEAVAFAATMAFYVLYFFLGVLVGGFMLLRQQRLLPRPAAYCGVTMGVLGILEILNEFPLSWMDYDTAKPVAVHYAELVVSVMSGLLFKSLLSTMLFAAAEGLDRAAFRKHKQIFRVTDRLAAASVPVATEVALSYLAVPAFFAYAVTFYKTALYSGWWLPSSSLSDPNVVAMYFPWYQPLAEAFSAGILEEAMFRVIPIAGSTLLYRRFIAEGTAAETCIAEPPWWWVVLTQIAQAVIFGAAHANYPAQPAYARLIELIIPSFAFAFLYLRYGLVAGMTLHWLYDVVWMALPIFTTNLMVSQGLVVLVSASPAIYVIWARINEGRWLALSPTFLNNAWLPPTQNVQSADKIRISGGPSNIDAFVRRSLPVAALVFFGIWCNQTNLGQCKHAPVLTISREEAIAAALTEAGKLHPDFVGYNTSSGDRIPGGWRVMTAMLATKTAQDVFVFETDPNHAVCDPMYPAFNSGHRTVQDGESIYEQQMKTGFLAPPHWSVRMARFDCDCELDVSDRAEEIAVGVANSDEIVWVHHTVPEHFAGNNLTESEAQALALGIAEATISTSGSGLRVVSSGPMKRIERLDWSVTFSHGQKLIHPGFRSAPGVEPDSRPEDLEPVEGESRIQVTLVNGKMAGWNKFVHVPEVWNRHEMTDKTAVNVILSGFGTLYTLVVSLTGLVALGVWGTGWAGAYQSSMFWRYLGVLMALHACNTFNAFESLQHQFPTAQPWMSTAVKTVIHQMFQAFTRSLMSALQFSLALTLKPQRVDKDKQQLGILSFAPGMVAGLGFVAAHHCSIWMWERESPVWPGLVDANAAWPPVAVLPLNVTLRLMHELPVTLLGVIAATILFRSSGDVDVAPPAMHKLAMYFVPARIIVAAPAMLPTVTWDALLPWTFSQVVIALVTATVFRLIYRHDLGQMPSGYCVALAMHIVNEWMLREHYDSAAVVSTVVVLGYAASLVRRLLL